ncbi:SigE family RNA polymerase sigma factor [Actinoallomurus bryophytorum]|uniref:RNA polymerase sigma-70 factor (Sigma-E family) n=1 Tax=Actinoallomurus bryophytorum TaxID=1490222 RepID=A0A543CG56_9ACTN|nr:RNA polymerase sigma-70 factor (sigma-E family) [Actinoallomurus bryophytorum]
MSEVMSFEEFVGARADALMRYAYVLTGNPDDAADLLQESLVRVRGAWHGVINKREPEGYVRTTMARLHISVWRSRRRERLVPEPPERGYQDEAFARADGDDGLWLALVGLPRKQRAVLVLRYYESLTDAEIADVLGISRGTVRSQASRALEKLRTTWRPSVTNGSVR